ncbi:ABC transporter permease [Spiroplasma endosymbiont of Anurida maritima]|uniref:ABC transporter permease n=1 Tax=Spiroplasma endosymbiont of Anurida maritima TaxID=2967972 RepID=UPI0036D306CA
MKNIIKSYLKLYIKNFIEAIGSIFFIIIIVTTFAGSLSGPIQFTYQKEVLKATSKQWNNYLRPENSEKNFLTSFKDGILTDYLFENITADGTQFVDEPILTKAFMDKMNEEIESENDEEKAILTNIYLENHLENIIEDRSYIFLPENIEEYGLTDYGMDYVKNVNYDVMTEIYETVFLSEKNTIIANQSIKLSNKNSMTYVSHFENTDFLGRNTDYNKIKLYEGALPVENNEVLITPAHQSSKNIKIGDYIEYEFESTEDVPAKYKVTGVGLTLDNLIYKETREWKREDTNLNVFFSEDFTRYSGVYMSKKALNNFMNYVISKDSKSIYRTDVISDHILQINSQEDFKANANKLFINDYDMLIPYEYSLAPNVTRTISMLITIFMGITIVLVLVGFIFLNFVTKKEINNSRNELGIFKAFGYSNKQLSWIFTIKLLLTTIVGSLLGYLLSFPIQMYTNVLYINSVQLPISMLYTGPIFLTILFVVLPLLFALLSYILTITLLRKKTTEMLAPKHAFKINYMSRFISWTFQKTPFYIRMQVAFTLKAFWKWLSVMAILFISTSLLIFSFGIQEVYKGESEGAVAEYNSNVKYYSDFSNETYETAKVNNRDTNKRVNLKNENSTQYIEYTGSLLDYPDILKYNKQFEKEILQPLKVVSSKYTFGLITVEQAKNQQVEILSDSEIMANFFANKSFTLENMAVLILVLDTVWENKDDEFLSLSWAPGWADKIVKMYFANLQGNNETKIVSFNKEYYKKDVNELFISDSFEDILEEQNSKSTRTYVNFIKKEQAGTFFNLGASTKQLEKMFADIPSDWDESEGIPAVISRKMSMYKGLGIGDTFSLQNRDRNNKDYLFKTVGISKKATLFQKMYINYEYIPKIYNDYQGKEIKVEDIKFNNIISKEELEEKENILIDLYNYGHIDNVSKKKSITDYTFSDILKLENKETSAQLYENVAPNIYDIYYVASLKGLIENEMELLNGIISITQALVATLIVIVFVVIVSGIVDENSKTILALRALGYRKRDINFLVIGNYIIGIVIVFVLALLASYAIWGIMVNILFTNLGIIINIPTNWTVPVISFITIMITVILSWIAAISIINRKHISEIME